MNSERTDLAQRARRHAALGDVARLQVVDALALSDRSPSELQDVVGLPSNLMSHHLQVLQGAGIVARRRSEGDRRRTYLTLTDRSVVDPADEAMAAPRVLFVCSANSARSQLAAASWTRSSVVPAASAGTHPATQVAEGAHETARRHGLDLTGCVPRLVTEVSEAHDLVVAVCDAAYEELGDLVGVHWSIPDPAAGGRAAFDAAFDEIDRRVTELAARLAVSQR
jgi:protein-tyrosine-phosphatase/DNA-binding transcriptional ArsR family regulator